VLGHGGCKLIEMNRSAFTLLVVCMILESSCGVLPASTPLLTVSPASAETYVAQTVEAVFTQTAASAPTFQFATLTPSPTATTTPTPTITLTPFLGAASADLECSVLTQSVRNGAHFDPGESFDVGWKVRNTGRLGWDAGVVYFAYSGGRKMDRDDVYYLPGTVSPGNVAALSASMVAPRKAGGYTTIWSLRRGAVRFCSVSLTIYVP
jgi:hypothetical protein